MSSSEVRNQNASDSNKPLLKGTRDPVGRSSLVLSSRSMERVVKPTRTCASTRSSPSSPKVLVMEASSFKNEESERIVKQYESGPTVIRSKSMRLQMLLAKLLRYPVTKALQVTLLIYICLETFGPNGLTDENGTIVDPESDERTDRGVVLINGTERPLVVETTFQLICLGISRSTAFFMYPTLVAVFLTKFRATGSFLAHTPISMFLPNDFHKLHLYCGWTILICSILHGVAHTARWAQQENLHLFTSNYAGISAIVICISLLLVCLPMIVYRDKIKYEIRKNLHYMFLVFALALCFHAPASATPNGGFAPWVFGTLLIWYFLDACICTCFMTEKIDTTKFQVLKNGVQITMKVSEAFQKRTEGNYVYVCLPWVDKKQWHAFSVFDNPADPEERQIFMETAGDWTEQVTQILKRDTCRPAWIQGPFPSPFNNAEEYDNQILVATGIGITPALAVISAHKASRRINLIWIVRDLSLLKFFLRHATFDDGGWNLIFYSGTVPLDEEDLEIVASADICIIMGRPCLGNVVPNIIYSIESQRGLPELYFSSRQAQQNDNKSFYDSKGDGNNRIRFLEGALRSQSRQMEALETNLRQAETRLSEAEVKLLSLAETDESHFLSGTSSVDSSMRSSTSGEFQNSKLGNLRSDLMQARRVLSQRLIGLSTSTTSETQTSDSSDLEDGNNGSIETILDGKDASEKFIKPWEHHPGMENFIRDHCDEKVLATWGILYCGGSTGIKSQLKTISNHYGVDLHVESCDW